MQLYLDAILALEQKWKLILAKTPHPIYALVLASVRTETWFKLWPMW